MGFRTFTKTAFAGIAATALASCAWGFDWKFTSAPMMPDASTGGESGGILRMSLPSKRTCCWWEGTASVKAGRGVRFAAKAEIALGAGEADAFNDLMMYVTWYDPKAGNRKGVRFLQRDFIDYVDERLPDGRIVRRFDQTLATPGECDTVRIDFIGKWHRMDVALSDVKAADVDAPKPRIVRCVVGNPHEKWVRDWSDPVAARQSRLAQIEACLTNIFANVERPDIVLFSETFADTGSPCPEKTAEPIPGGPSFQLAAKYAVKYRTHVAMCIREVTKEGTHHNSTFIVDREGRHAGTYRKTTLTSGEYMGGLLPGDDFKVFKLDFGAVGCLTCWDNWFSESAKYLRRKGAEMILFPLAGCAWDHVDVVFPARAIDTGLPFLVSMRQGHLPNGIIDRDGTWVAKTFEDGGFAWADIDLNERKRTFWLSVGPGMGDPYDLYVNESRPELYEKQNLRGGKK